MFHLVEMSRCGEDEHHGQGVQSGMLPRGKNMHTSRSYRSKDQPCCQQYDENEHKKAESKPLTVGMIPRNPNHLRSRPSTEKHVKQPE